MLSARFIYPGGADGDCNFPILVRHVGRVGMLMGDITLILYCTILYYTIVQYVQCGLYQLTGSGRWQEVTSVPVY